MLLLLIRFCGSLIGWQRPRGLRPATAATTNNNKNVTGITYDSHDKMVIKSFEEIYNEANQKLDINDKAVFIERTNSELLVFFIPRNKKTGEKLHSNGRWFFDDTNEAIPSHQLK